MESVIRFVILTHVHWTIMCVIQTPGMTADLCATEQVIPVTIVCIRVLTAIPQRPVLHVQQTQTQFSNCFMKTIVILSVHPTLFVTETSAKHVIATVQHVKPQSLIVPVAALG